MTNSTKTLYAGHRFPPELISYTVWLYYRFPLSLRMVEEMLAARGIEVGHETVRRWAEKFGREFANRIRRIPVTVPAGESQGAFVTVEEGILVPPGTGDFDIEVGLGGGAGEKPAKRQRARQPG